MSFSTCIVPVAIALSSVWKSGFGAADDIHATHSGNRVSSEAKGKAMVGCKKTNWVTGLLLAYLSAIHYVLYCAAIGN
ncbi:hypothetical protein [Paucibacter sp. Y2R2-4]|uniref:hypothetical protein n=1 Tax=Paucibacter sp. Y2R2-4 TaxID=2893553 RepID=UPI0021E3DB46|nr:hypothetical protein [Paucibacter sp. Y2R2-4]MCV2352283.1 hypothetical protein [Paucibacter sp. Y2R2-4]